MTDTTLQELMHAVLDGEASAAQARTLENALASDPAARDRFEELQRLFRTLEEVPELSPPSHLVHTVTARAVLPRQPFRWSRVSELLMDLFMGDMTMRNKRTVWVGISLAAVAIIAGGYYVFDLPLPQDLSGTVAPAQRYRAPQIQSQEVKLGDQTIAKLMQNEAVDKLVRDPGFQKLAANPQAMQAFAANAQAFSAMMSSAQAFTAMANNAQAFQAFAASPQVLQLIASMPQAFAALAASPQVLQAIASNPNAYASFANNPQAFAAAAASRKRSRRCRPTRRPSRRSPPTSRR